MEKLIEIVEELLDCSELNLHRMQPHTESVIEKAIAYLEELKKDKEKLSTLEDWKGSLFGNPIYERTYSCEYETVGEMWSRITGPV